MEVVPVKRSQGEAGEEPPPHPGIARLAITSEGESGAATTPPGRGHGAQIVTVTESHSYNLDERALQSILLRDEIKDLPVVVVSVAGAFRRGKSFLLNFFIRYLTAPESAQKDGSWLGDDSEPLAGFSWCSGIKRNTTGILLWSEPIVRTLPSGQKVAVLLMDTQGTFDGQSTVRDCSTIFALSTLLSSVQIYNLSNNIQEDDLQHLQLFTEYGRIVRDKQGSTAFQVLEFLVRDWQFPDDYEYGAAGGHRFLEDKLAITPSMPQEMKNLRLHITSCFEKMSCFLMPHPGFKVLSKKFDGKISDIDADFRDYLKELVSSLFGPEKLRPKSINGEPVRAADLCTYFHTYVSSFNSDKIPSTKTIMEATVQAGMLAAASEARALYEAGMDAACGPARPSVPAYDLQDLHDNHLAKASAAFTDKKKMGSSKEAKRYHKKLTEELSDRLPMYQQSNLAKTQEAIDKAKDAYEEQISAVSGGRPLCVHPDDLQQVHQQGFRAARDIFDRNRRHFSSKKDKEREAFLDSFSKRYSLLRLANEQSHKLVAGQLRMEYFTRVQEQCNVSPPLPEHELHRAHLLALDRALQDFLASRNRGTDRDDDDFKQELIEDIEKTYANLKAMNRSMNKMAIQTSVSVYNERMSAAWDVRRECLAPASLQRAHHEARAQAVDAFRPQHDQRQDVPDPDLYTLDDIISQRHDELRKINEAANETGVQEAFNVYCSTMEDLCRASLWWLLIIPFVVYLANKSGYHDQAQDKAKDVFFSKRRNRSCSSDDPYLKDLKKKMKEAYSKY